MMSRSVDNPRDRYQRFWEQLAEVGRRHPSASLAVAPAAARAGSGAAPRYVYEAGQLLLCAQDPGRVDQLADRARRELPQRVGEPELVRDGLLKVELAEGTDVPAEVDRFNESLERDGDPEVDRRAGRVAASPNHVVSIAYPVNLCPADEPEPVPPATPVWPPPAGSGGDGVRVLVIDTGLADGYRSHPWLADVEGAPREVSAPDDPYQLVRQYAGHGTFVAGVLRCAAPGVELTVANTLMRAGALLEDELGTAILDLLERDGWPHIISLSAGGTSHRNCDLLGLRSFLDRLGHDRAAAHTVLVAAAGNDGNDSNLFFPAASAPRHPGVISVGALRRDQRGRACFSNYGSSVTVFAAGEYHVNAFLSGLYAYQHQPEPACRFHSPPLYVPCPCSRAPDYGTVVHFSGLARWSGTSFATPLVAGVIATHMTRTGERHDARSAARDLLARNLVELRHGDEVLPVLPLPGAE
jgi:subtilisin family serine protease